MASLHFVPFEKEMIEFIVVCSAMQPVKKSAAAGASCRRHTVADFLYIMYVLFTIDTPASRGVRGVSRDQYGPIFAKGGHKGHAVYHVRERCFFSL